MRHFVITFSFSSHAGCRVSNFRPLTMLNAELKILVKVLSN